MVGINNPGLEMSFHLGKRRKSPICLMSDWCHLPTGLSFCVRLSHLNDYLLYREYLKVHKRNSEKPTKDREQKKIETDCMKNGDPFFAFVSVTHNTLQASIFDIWRYFCE